MASVVFVSEASGAREVEAKIGSSLMAVAKAHQIDGIEATCGGSLACGTCHVIVDPAWFARTGEPTEMETQLLDYVDGVEPTSRLSCQITITNELDGLTVTVPPS